ncbi:MAG TPA: Ig-like domain-containing protein [Pyrinomonadaceae bacterium]
MRLARRAYLVALAMLILCAAVSAQTLRNENDPRNTAPTVGTGGPPGGPTGLFTIYDGQTLRRGEFTFSIAYSNFDRDPGDVDITEIPVSFQVGVGDHLELFFNTDAYRGIKVNSPANLSSFYLPNSQLFFGPGLLRSGPAIIIAPTGIPGIGGTAIFRPTGAQPFIAYPFVGGSAGLIGGIPRFISAPIRNTGGSGNYGGADIFPGIGSPVGSILPGIVLATNTFATPFGPRTFPATFTVAPSYLPDAPFLNRLYGQSAFNTFTVGAKWRWTSPNNPFGIGVIPFYRWYADKADDASGFNQLQRGASPGGDIGDFGLIGFFDGRLSRSVNLSANLGYILNSNPKGTFPTGTFTLLDRPDEFIAGVGFDFPINKWFQPIIELRSTQYVGGRTPNAFENSPVEGLAGLRVFPRRWWGMSFGYRYHFNQQDMNSFQGRDITSTINVPGVGPQIISATAGSFPRGFRPSSDAHGFLFQFFIGRRNPRAPEYLPNQAPTVSLAAAESSITLACPAGTRPTNCTISPDQVVALTANASDPDGDTLLYTYTTTGGRITGEGASVTWDLTGAQPGTYTATVEVDDGCGCVSFSSTTVTVAEPPTGCCVPPCPNVSVDCPTGITEAGTPVTFTANVSGGDPNASLTYNWTVSAGTITSGQGTPSITVDTTGLGGQTITGTVELGGVAPECNRTASCSTQIGVTPRARKFDEYNNIAFNDEKARLDNFAIELNNNPGAQGYIIAYGGRKARANEAQARADRAKDYLVNTRGIDAGRIVTVDGGYKEDLTVELWIVPTGATPPTASPTVDASEVQIIKGRVTKPRRPRRGGRRR